MNRKKILLKTAQLAKKHRLPVNVIVWLFAIIILCCYLKDFVFKAAGCVFMPFLYMAGKICHLISIIFLSVSKFFRRHRRIVLKIECGITTVGLLLLIIFNDNVLESVWGDENTGVFAEEVTEKSEENTSNLQITEGEKEYNTVEEEKVAVSTPDNSISEQLPYYIKLNRVMNTVTIYTYDENGEYTIPVRAMRCATGGENTPLGTYSLSDRFVFAELLYNSYGQYCTRISGPILFHSSTYTSLKKDSLSSEDYNLLGEGISHGCVRLTTADAKWIYENCAKGTVVCIYDDDKTPGPLGKPETIKVPDGTLWDPTDPDPANPWANSSPVIAGAESKTVFEYDGYDVMNGISALDTCGNDITDKIVIDGTVDMEIPGVYTITYKVTDLLGRSDEVTVNITVR